ncbi:MAG: enoyl-CoA hydratase [Gammaproteobacteria bacterium]|nr:enoyl-CoA hydratase [Gammaproteobacteria bacterium]
MQETLKVEKVTESIVRLTMDDEKTGNALSDHMISLLSTTIKEVSDDKSIKVIVIAATGKIFCSGHNLKEITAARKNNDQGERYFLDLFKSCSALMQSIVYCPKPVIAEIDGVATAAGCQLVASCDLAIASDSSSFATPGVNLGLFCSTPMVALSRNVKKKDAMKMLLTGDMIDSSEAKRISLINDHVPSKNLSTEVMQLANKIASKSMQTVKIGKSAFYKQSELSLSEAYKYTSEIMAENTMNADAKEGISSFLEKRDPKWE